jgi:hypothetical protein
VRHSAIDVSSIYWPVSKSHVPPSCIFDTGCSSIYAFGRNSTDVPEHHQQQGQQENLVFLKEFRHIDLILIIQYRKDDLVLFMVELH